jgi:hypothetical protein
MRFHWLRDQEAQGQFRIYWWPGKSNLADYFTKHHPPAHHVNVRAEFLKRSRRSKTSAETTRIDQNRKATSYKGVLDFPYTCVRIEATYAI